MSCLYGLVSFFVSFLNTFFFLGALSIRKTNPAKYKHVIRSYRCEKTHEKSSGMMESDAVLKIFKRLSSRYGIYYTRYVGDGDSKTFAALSKTTPYPGIDNIFYFKNVLSVI
jgi:hypothetical protein